MGILELGLSEDVSGNIDVFRLGAKEIIVSNDYETFFKPGIHLDLRDWNIHQGT